MYKNRRFKPIMFSKYANNMKTTIFQRSLTNLGLLRLLFEFNNFSFLINIIDNIINTSISRDQNSHQWQCIIFVTCLRLYHVTSKLHCHWRKFWSHDTDVLIILSIISIKNENDWIQIIIGANLTLLDSSGMLSFSDW